MEIGQTVPSSATGVSVYYPYDLVQFVDLASDDEDPQIVLLSFLDTGGCRITLRVRRSAFRALAPSLRLT